MSGDTLNKYMICEKAKKHFIDLINKNHKNVPEWYVFNPSHGLFEKFKKRIGINSILRHTEGSGEYEVAIVKFQVDLKKFSPK